MKMVLNSDDDDDDDDDIQFLEFLTYKKKFSS